MAEATDRPNRWLATSVRPQRRWLRIAQLAGVTLTGLVIRALFLQTAGYHDDLVIFFDWFRAIATLPPAQVYAHTPGLNYPPMVVVLYELEAQIVRRLGVGLLDGYGLNLVIKLPPVLFDAAGSVLIYAIVRRYADHTRALAGAAFIALNPAFMYDSAFWGQNDSIPTVLALFALFSLAFGSTVVAWISIAAALFFKPPVLVLVPLMLAHPFRFTGEPRRRRLIATAVGIVAAAAIGELLAVTFFDHSSILVATRHLVGQYVGAANVFHYTSLNAFNVWALAARMFTSDATKFWGLSLQRWSDLAFIVTAAAIYWRYLSSRSATALFEAAALVLLAFFVLLTEMHERYLYYALFFCGALIFKRPYGYAALILSVTLLLNCEYGLTFMYLDDAKAAMVDRFAFSPWLIRLCSLANLATFGWLARNFFADPAPQRVLSMTVRSSPASELYSRTVRQ